MAQHCAPTAKPDKEHICLLIEFALMSSGLNCGGKLFVVLQRFLFVVRTFSTPADGQVYMLCIFFNMR